MNPWPASSMMMLAVTTIDGSTGTSRARRTTANVVASIPPATWA